VADAQVIRVALEIDDHNLTISGRLVLEGAPMVVFYGWLELIDQLERAWRHDAAAAPQEGVGRSEDEQR
jgi:hypothetical protein